MTHDPFETFASSDEYHFLSQQQTKIHLDSQRAQDQFFGDVLMGRFTELEPESHLVVTYNVLKPYTSIIL